MDIVLPQDFKEFLKLLKDLNLELFKLNKKASGRHKDLDDLENLP
jgi:hypothetical protein